MWVVQITINLKSCIIVEIINGNNEIKYEAINSTNSYNNNLGAIQRKNKPRSYITTESSEDSEARKAREERRTTRRPWESRF